MPRKNNKPAPAAPAPTKSSRLRTLATSLPLILTVALLLRALFAWDYIRQNPRHALGVIPFLEEAGNIAASLATGHGFSSPFRIDTGPTAWMTPIYPALLAGIFRLFGVRTFDSFVAAVALNVVASVLVCVPIFYAGKKIVGTNVGAGAAWLWAIFPNAILNTFQSMWEASLAALLVALILWATLKLDQPRGWPGWFGYGLLWGAALMTNATLGGLLPLLLGWLAFRSWKPGRAWKERHEWFRRPLLSLGVAILCCLPWTLRNYEVLHAFVPLRSVFGLQFFVGNNEHAQEIWLGEQHPIHDSAERAEYIRLGELAYMRDKQRQAFEYVQEHPARVLHLTASRFIATWSGGTPSPVADFLHTPSLWFRYVLLFNVLAALGALAGIIILIRRRSPYCFPLAVFPVVYPCAYYVTLAYPRYRLPIDPVVLLLVA
ncbi:MAG TPA: glycosyltransferase family 39 protein, partial [Candidatus Limnocylindrales bacterium]|nr:glycosyltransferase family 39 protein [Candidatus Limnocylindrales bacterium]